MERGRGPGDSIRSRWPAFSRTVGIPATVQGRGQGFRWPGHRERQTPTGRHRLHRHRPAPGGGKTIRLARTLPQTGEGPGGFHRIRRCLDTGCIHAKVNAIRSTKNGLGILSQTLSVFDYRRDQVEDDHLGL